jgi:hypothetical protein
MMATMVKTEGSTPQQQLGKKRNKRPDQQHQQNNNHNNYNNNGNNNMQSQQWTRLSGAPTWEIPAIDNASEKKFTG